MKILKADHLGMCFGVRDAIEMAKTAATAQPLTVLGELVHNETVLSDLKRLGVRIARSLDEVDTPNAMITAHGASERAISAARSVGLNVTQATCPLVRAAHRAAASLVQQGYHPVIVGKSDHVEVRGITEDLEAFDVVLTEADVMDLAPKAKFGVLAQTTQPIERVRYLAGLLRWRFQASEVRLVDTVCQPTKQRQNAAREVAARADVVIVVGGANSNNTRELARTCASFCSRVFQVETSVELRPEWLLDAQVVGLTAGTSTPDEVINNVEARLRELANALDSSAPLEPVVEHRERAAAA